MFWARAADATPRSGTFESENYHLETWRVLGGYAQVRRKKYKVFDLTYAQF
jgi:hypothetical protein